MRILLVDPPGRNKGLNTGLGYLSAVLRAHHEVRVLDLNNMEVGFCGDPNPTLPQKTLEERIYGAIDELEPELFGISVKTFTAGISKWIFQLVRAYRPEIAMVAGGPHITLDGSNFMQEANVDFAIQGEGEYSLQELCKALESATDMQRFEGVIYREKGELIHRTRGETIQDLDVLPLPDYLSFSSVIENEGRLREYPLLTSRGCPFNCSYCSMPNIMGRRWRSRLPRRVIEELKHAKHTYQSESFTVVDDNFTLNLKRVEEICDLLVSEQLHLPWNSQNGIRADRINEELAKKMKRSGCRHVWIGIESADETVFQQINKGEALEDVKAGIRHLRAAGIRVGGFFIVGLPHSTRETDLRAIAFVKENQIDGWWFNFIPYPHTQAWNWVKTHGRILRPLDGALQYGSDSLQPVFETDDYPGAQRAKTYNEIHIQLKYFDRLVDESLSQVEKWKRLFKMAQPYGFGSLLSLAYFILKYNADLLLTRVGIRS
jgi:anaerobic magnesium-protoporphyrin IX monomethyl ester cyclase